MVSRRGRGLPWRVLALSAVATVATIVGYLGLTGGLAAVELGQAKQRTDEIVVQAGSPDPNLTAIINDIGLLRSDLIRAQEYTSGPAWWAASQVPILGPRVDAVRRLTESGGELATASAEAEGVVRAFAAVDGGSVGQALPKPLLAQVGPATRRVAAAIGHAQEQIGGIDADALGKPLGGVVAKMQQRLGSIGPEVQALAGAADSIVFLLGVDGPKTWFVAMQNGGESRGTGGLVGAFAVMRVSSGATQIERLGPNDVLTAKADPALLPTDSRALWGDARLEEIYGVNLSPHYPFAAALLGDVWKRQAGNTPDAVLALDQRAVASLIGAAGPITVDDVTLTGTNAFDWLTVGAYRKYTSPQAKDASVLRVTEELMKRLTSGGVSTVSLARAAIDSILGRHMYLWAKTPMAQAPLEASVIGGAVPERPGMFTMAVVNNNAGNKLDTFLHTTVRYEGRECVTGGRRAMVSVELRNDAPIGLPDSYFGRGDRATLEGGSARSDGSNRVRVAVYLPEGAFVDDGQFSKPGPGVAKPLFRGTERGHPVLMFAAELPRGAIQNLSVEFTAFGAVDSLNATPVVQPQPMLNPQTIEKTDGPRC